jgi:hypothetical protein
MSYQLTWQRCSVAHRSSLGMGALSLEADRSLTAARAGIGGRPAERDDQHQESRVRQYRRGGGAVPPLAPVVARFGGAPILRCDSAVERVRGVSRVQDFERLSLHIHFGSIAALVVDLRRTPLRIFPPERSSDRGGPRSHRCKHTAMRSGLDRLRECRWSSECALPDAKQSV